MAAKARPEFTAYVKAHHIKGGEKQGRAGQLGACPFSHRVLLLLEEKGVTYNLEFINLDKKPEWCVRRPRQRCDRPTAPHPQPPPRSPSCRLLEANPAGTVPGLKDNETGRYISDSDNISDYLEDKYAPGSGLERPPLGHLADVPHPGAALWPRFMDFLTGKGDRAALEAQLREVEDTVGDKSPYVGGKTVNDWDFAADYPHLKAYLARWSGRASWRNTASWDEESIVEELRAKVDQRQEK